MTASEYARLANLKEFAAQCAEARQRALEVAAQRKAERETAVRRWLGKADIARPVNGARTLPVSKPKASPVTKPPKAITKPGRKAVLHQGRTMREWADNLGISYSALACRASRRGSLEAALAEITSTMNISTGGYDKALTPTLGTGDGSIARDRDHSTDAEGATS